MAQIHQLIFSQIRCFVFFVCFVNWDMPGNFLKKLFTNTSYCYWCLYEITCFVRNCVRTCQIFKNGRMAEMASINIFSLLELSIFCLVCKLGHVLGFS